MEGKQKPNTTPNSGDGALPDIFMEVMEISNETSPTGRAKGIFSTFDHISFCLSDLIFPLLDSPVISAHCWIMVENVRQPIIPAVLSSAVVCPNRDRGKTSMAETDKTMRKEKEEEEGGGNEPFQNQET